MSSPLRGRIVYVRHPSPCTQCVPEIWSVRVDGTDARYLAPAFHWPGHLRVSPDGTRVVFVDWSILYILSADGQESRPIATGLYPQYAPVWSPDGEWIVFGGLDPATSTEQIYRIHPDGTDREMLTDPAPGRATQPTISPDGTELFFIRNPPGGAWLPKILDLATGDERLAIDTATVVFSGSNPDWSPDGTKIALVAGQGPISGWGVWILDPHSGQYAMIADAHGNRGPVWSSDGSKLLVGSGDLWIMSADGTDPRLLLSDGFTNRDADWGPP